MVETIVDEVDRVVSKLADGRLRDLAERDRRRPVAWARADLEAGPRAHADRARRLRGSPHPAGVRAVRQDPRARRARDPSARARRARPRARPLPAERADRHRDRPGRGRAAAAPRRRDLPDPAPARRARRERDVAARGLHRGERRDAHRAGQPPLDDELPDRDTPTPSVEMPAGSALLYLGSLWHGGGANRTDRAAARRRAALRRRLAPAGREPRARRAARRRARRCRNGCRSCSATTSSRRSSATSTAATREAPDRSGQHA